MVSFSAIVLPGAALFGRLLKLTLSNVSVRGFGMLLTSDAGAPGVSGRCADAGEAKKPNPKRASAAPIASDCRLRAVDGCIARSPRRNDSTGLAAMDSSVVGGILGQVHERVGLGGISRAKIPGTQPWPSDHQNRPGEDVSKNC